MRYIAHRGNIYGKNIYEENSPSYINKAINLGYDVEIDVWSIDNELFLGHDSPLYKVKYSFFVNPKIWTHCKNSQALLFFSQNNNTSLNFFWHEKDEYTITSKGVVWAYPGSVLNSYTVCVLPEDTTNYTLKDIKNSYGICSDKIEKYKKLIELC
jgi:hypothetical protein